MSNVWPISPSASTLIKAFAKQCIPGPEVIKLEFILKLKIKRNQIGCLRTHVRKQPIVALYFEFETVLKVYNLEAR